MMGIADGVVVGLFECSLTAEAEDSSAETGLA